MIFSAESFEWNFIRNLYSMFDSFVYAGMERRSLFIIVCVFSVIFVQFLNTQNMYFKKKKLIKKFNNGVACISVVGLSVWWRCPFNQSCISFQHTRFPGRSFCFSLSRWTALILAHAHFAHIDVDSVLSSSSFGDTRSDSMRYIYVYIVGIPWPASAAALSFIQTLDSRRII